MGLKDLLFEIVDGVKTVDVTSLEVLAQRADPTKAFSLYAYPKIIKGNGSKLAIGNSPLCATFEFQTRSLDLGLRYTPQTFDLGLMSGGLTQTDREMLALKVLLTTVKSVDQVREATRHLAFNVLWQGKFLTPQQIAYVRERSQVLGIIELPIR